MTKTINLETAENEIKYLENVVEDIERDITSLTEKLNSVTAKFTVSICMSDLEWVKQYTEKLEDKFNDLKAKRETIKTLRYVLQIRG